MIFRSLNCSPRLSKTRSDTTFFDEYCSTVQGLLDWFEVDLGFTKLRLFRWILCTVCYLVSFALHSLSSCPFWTSLNCLPRAAGVPLESDLNLVSHMGHCGARDPTLVLCASERDGTQIRQNARGP